MGRDAPMALSTNTAAIVALSVRRTIRLRMQNLTSGESDDGIDDAR
jgi:hypothetical protein